MSSISLISGLSFVLILSLSWTKAYQESSATAEWKKFSLDNYYGNLSNPDRQCKSVSSCKPRAYLHHLNPDPLNFQFRPSVVKVQRCSGPCDTANKEKRCLPIYSTTTPNLYVKRRNVTVTVLELKVKPSESMGGSEKRQIQVEVEDHLACCCGAPSPACNQSRVENKQTCEKSGTGNSTADPMPNYVRFRWSANKCACVRERFYYPDFDEEFQVDEQPRIQQQKPHHYPK